MENTSIPYELNKSAACKNIPLNFFAEVTYACNLRCYYCYNCPDAGRSELTASQWQQVFAHLADMGCLFLTISGGEPFARSDIFEIIEGARKFSFAVSLITNGTLIDADKAKRLSELSVVDVGVSFHAADPVIHDMLTGSAGSFAAAYRGMKLLQENNVPVIMKHTVSNKNFGQYRALSKMAEKENAFFECDAVIFSGKHLAVSMFSVEIEQYQQFFDDMGIGGAVAGPKTDADDNLHCDAGRNLGGITPYGDVYPCIQLPLLWGNVGEMPIYSIWNSQAAHQYRMDEKNVGQECTQCSTKRFCSRCPGLSFVETGLWQDASPSLCKRAKALEQKSMGVV
ncbi:MAG: hypothetical protein A2268_01625 [Candidatus Raymondbacteria bacterium RifOxyA12_full_50_37]|uniref:Radical SAM core domain-containing protein n=1 Tax=Candidatus Raymondbacteria bacterium RIFOXYD12_FULL_49_13 TaxID=1817890 RepID=A0A1F7F9Q7_UNCRA|nr:MAG: hypothetical protein A2268_01625 [Candidatus Raymondbacteria bacterium RifOxyA12_full_50_37]OGJ87765.1 MAG: hypothetical protein A2248_07230 [Candidatus Raymondbacteria bacterium RIFOXYA2_FULL_49_16]OGJ95643.1 MAG: hypothetical protein A2453_13225 [Candidatus Raymondbacteria bacterium RIFOXYC2_FULL_50_21]OGJ99682.1 MAG: hypothetical protein A2487_11200 [Candidatus Raymondbacteria bacterium RifOxyC12_full_50_8]OGK03414.1 MAG: hypothetical protein A2519_15505 [Candidatus Raymondbacteria b